MKQFFAFVAVFIGSLGGSIAAETAPVNQLRGGVALVEAEPELRVGLPTGCTVRRLGDAGWSRCTGGTGQHRVAIGCPYPPTHGFVTRYGPWMPPTSMSAARCDYGVYPTSGWVQRR